MAGLIEEQYQGFYDAKVKPHVDGRNVEYRGLLSQAELAPLYQRAAGVLFPISWCEPFGLVAVEAQASGTPIIATRYGALPEIIVEGQTGFVVDTVAMCTIMIVPLSSFGSSDFRSRCRAVMPGYS